MEATYPTTKGQCIKALKEKGINRHPQDLRKLELHKHSEVLNVYFKYAHAK
ncbi:DUF2639 domain-containing protein [Bacillus cereus]|uniref:DUF2639 domain-containing protein n=1 Tax=Bacillus cereus group TaxID=86661 RepID=UPI000A301A67|nr:MULTISPECIES: DUF2639 domain-containing protein [Bacillus cereus group]HDR7922212.1 DUF2639 domain-containing protein [Bacillus paranthracis]MDF9598988.1 DUF2639 domain-containing protein [Bacillus cereus]MDG1589321.1 DUF2639 domain-containing protein [Bacillus cereus]MDX5808607.1 DUF2639 domain-containing protein [Bacillus cereus group sp. BfR-BA-02730]SME50620.1 hypothetical protein BACERE00183_04531 [Bacillus cereus]